MNKWIEFTLGISVGFLLSLIVVAFYNPAPDWMFWSIFGMAVVSGSPAIIIVERNKSRRKAN